MATEDSVLVIADNVEAFVREQVIPYEGDTRIGLHGPGEDLVTELRDKARAAGLMTPHIKDNGEHLSQQATAEILIRSGLSPLGPLACGVAAPDEGNMLLLSKVASAEQKLRYLAPLVDGTARSAFFMTEPAVDGGAGSDPSLLNTDAKLDGNHWVINGRKAFITGAEGAKVGIVMANSDRGASLFLVDLPNPAITIDRLLNTIDNSMPGGHAIVDIKNLRCSSDQMLGEPGDGFRLAQVRLAPARLSHCMRWLGLGIRAQEIATQYACSREAFGKTLIDHEGVGFKLADNQIDLQQCRLMTMWCAGILDRGESGNVESSMAKVAVSEGLFRVADRCVQVMGGTGITDDTIVAQFFREIRAFRIYDGPSEVHRWSLAKKIKKSFNASQSTKV